MICIYHTQEHQRVFPILLLSSSESDDSFRWTVLFQGLFSNTGFVHVRLPLCKVRQVFIIWSFNFFSPIISIFWSTVEISSQLFFDTVTFSFSKTKEELVDYDKYCKVKLFSGVISYGSSSEPEAYLELSQTSMGEHVCKDSYWLQAVNYFCKKNSFVDVLCGSKYASVIITLHSAVFRLSSF